MFGTKRRKGVSLSPVLIAAGCSAYKSLDGERGLISPVCSTVEIELIDYARRNRLVVLPEIEQQAVRGSREDMNDAIGVARSRHAHVIRNLFGKRGGVLTSSNALLTRTGRKSERNQFSHLG